MRTISAEAKLDAIDRAILNQLQSDARLSNLELAERIHLSPSACLRRVKALEDGGVIERYVALVAYFSDRGRLFQADRGRRFGAVGDALG